MDLYSGGPIFNRFCLRLLIIALISFVLIFIAGPLYIPIIAVIYFNNKKKKAISAVTNIVSNELREHVTYIDEVYHDQLQWGILAITNKSFVFVPKEGKKTLILHEEVRKIGHTRIGTGEYASLISKIPNSSLAVGSTTETKSSIFYVRKIDGNIDYWHTLKWKAFYQAATSQLGIITEPKQVNY